MGEVGGDLDRQWSNGEAAGRDFSEADSKVRVIDPAIYAETLGAYLTVKDEQRDVLVDRLSELHLAEKEKNNEGEPATYRCQSALGLSGDSLSTLTTDGSIRRTERRCVLGTPEPQSGIKRYVVNGHKVVQCSMASFSSSDSQLGGPGSTRNFAEKIRTRRKRKIGKGTTEEERAEMRRKEEEERAQRELRERANFLGWVERKKKEEVERKEAERKEAELRRRLKEIEEQTVVAKTICLQQWVRKKDEKLKALQKEQRSNQRKAEEEKERRLEKSSKAFEEWREKSKNKPKPATQGLLPHQKAIPAYVNPIPWQPVVQSEENNVDKPSESTTKRGARFPNRKLLGQRP
ncbi:stress response protein NST1 [Orussus abietinus]|uniref:stress response protein NST1 n=1 Tax=Orussus abietinus TaxID=222816 RepID=UPI0006266CEB|nr:stress response protein NST1 [Orussus abietinus]